MAPGTKPGQRLRTEIAQLAAKILATEGVTDYRTAKRKAAQRLRVDAQKNLPNNREIETALRDYLSLFHGEKQRRTLHRLRAQAKCAMEFLQAFTPQLTGPVLAGTATEHSEIVLHIALDEVEQLEFFLQEHGVAYENTFRSLRLAPEKLLDFPACRFLADTVPVVIIVFPLKQQHLKPLSPVDGKPMQRADLAQLARLMA